jgi:tryptophan 7-halogenase
LSEQAIRHVVIVGGGTAGWITAGLLAARHPDRSENGLRITLVESPDVPAIGVGEGTWPTIRQTLARMGIGEETFLRACNASFKQGSRFDGWVTGAPGDTYHHPFELPVSQNASDVLHAWTRFAPDKPFAEAVCAQVSPGLQGLAPRKRGMPDFHGALNYAYHLDAPRLAELICEHAVNRLGVTHIRDHVTGVVGSPDGPVEAITGAQTGPIHGDLFVDCTGHASLLLGQHYGVPFVDQGHVLFNDRAVVTQVPVDPDSPIVSETVSTAHDAGWIWDIGLPTRRGVGCVYSSAYMDDDRADEVLHRYIGARSHGAVRRLSFRSGHRAHFWHQNCVAIGLSAGFLEPLEASAIVLLELSADMLAENLPASRAAMPPEARRFNQLFLYRWGRIVEFLKFHYVLSRRRGAYWQDNRREDTIPERLRELMETWSHRPPGPHDFEHANEVFPLSSYLYVAYGMGMTPKLHPTLSPRAPGALQKQMQDIARRQRALASGLPTNRALLAGLAPQPVH